jgi:hypothetical protein
VRFWQVCTYLLVMLDTGQLRYAKGGSSCTHAMTGRQTENKHRQ